MVQGILIQFFKSVNIIVYSARKTSVLTFNHEMQEFYQNLVNYIALKNKHLFNLVGFYCSFLIFKRLFNQCMIIHRVKQ